jgi:periplasmic divalent cation tolerance protein
MGKGNPVVIGHVTFKDVAEAQTLCRRLVEERLIACANITPEIRSIYRWEGVVHDDIEARALIKTTAANAERILEFLKRNHSYSVPAVVFWPIDSGNSDYLTWVEKETSST